MIIGDKNSLRLLSLLVFSALLLLRSPAVLSDHGPEHTNPVSTPGGGTLSVSPAVIVDEGIVRYTYTPPGNFPDSYPSWERLTYKSGTLYYTQGYRASDPFFYFFRPVRWGSYGFTPNRERCPRAPEGASTEVILQYARQCDDLIGCTAGDRHCELKVFTNRREGEDWRGYFWPNCRAEYYLGPYPETDGGGSQAQSRINLFLRNAFDGFDAQITNPLTLTSSGPMPNCAVPDSVPLPEPKFEYTCDNDFGEKADVYIEPDTEVSGRIVFEADVYNLCDLYGGDFDFGDPGDPSFDGDCEPEVDFCGDELEACVEGSTVDWSFGDGNTLDYRSVYDYITNDYEQAGDYEVTATVQPFGDKTTCQLSLKPPEVIVDVEVTDGLDLFINGSGQQEARAAVDEVLDVSLTVKTTDGFGVVENLDFEYPVAAPTPDLDGPGDGEEDASDDVDNNENSESGQASTGDIPEYPLIYDNELFALSSVDEMVNPQRPDSFGPEEDVYKATYKLKAIKDGFTTLESFLSYTSLGEVVEVADAASFRIGEKVFDVKVVVTPEQLNFDETDRDSLGEECKARLEEFDATVGMAGTGEEPPENCIEFTIDITNITESEITNVTVSEFGDFTNAIKSLTPGDPSVPLNHVEVISPEGMGTTVNLPAGESVKFTVLMDAFSGSPELEVKPTVTGVYQGQNVKGSGTAEFKIVEDVVLKVAVRLQRPELDERNENYESANAPFSGAPIRLSGFLENYSTTKFVGATIVALPEENAGRGTLFDADGNGSDGRRLNGVVDTSSTDCTAFAENFSDEIPYFPQAFLLEPATENPSTGEIEPSRIDLRGVLATTCMDVFSRAKVRYYVKASTLETNEDGELITDDGNTIEQGGIANIDNQLSEERIEFDYSGNNQRDFSVPLKVNQFIELDDSTVCQYLEVGFDLVCSGVSGVYAMLHSTVTSIPVLLELGGQFIAKDFEYTWRLNHYALKMLGTTFESVVLQDPAAQQRLKTEIEVQAATWVQFGIITNEQAQNLVAAGFDNSVKAFEDFAQSDYRTMGRRVSFAAGSNIDALMPTKYTRGLTQLVSRTWRKAEMLAPSPEKRAALEAVRKKFRLPTEPDLPDNKRIAEAINEAQEDVKNKLSIQESDRIAQEFKDNPARDPGDLFNSDVLPPRTELSLSTAALSGASEQTIDKIRDICIKHSARCAFRSRGLLAIQKIKQGFAYLKGQAIKLKNTNDIDVKYLGYPPEALDTVVFVEPPVNIPKALREVIDAQGKSVLKKGWAEDLEVTRLLDEWMSTNTVPDFPAGLRQKPQGLEQIDNLISTGVGSGGSRIKFDIDQVQGLSDEITEYLKIRERLRLRVSEWHKYRSDSAFGRFEDIGKVIDGEVYRGGAFLTKGLPLRFGFKEQGLSSAFDQLPFLRGENRPFRITSATDVFDSTGRRTDLPTGQAVVYDAENRAVNLAEKVPGSERKIYVPEMNGPNGFRSFTGDIDFLHILDKSNTFIKNPFRRMAIYWELIQQVGMQHGESFSFFLQAVRASFLEAHTIQRGAPAETLIEVSEKGIFAAYYGSPKRTVLPELTNGLEIIDLDNSRFYINIDSPGATLRATQDQISRVLTARRSARQLRLFIEQILPRAINPIRNWANSIDGVEETDVSSLFDDGSGDDPMVLREEGGELYSLEPVAQSQNSQVVVSSLAIGGGFPTQSEVGVQTEANTVNGALFEWRPINIETAKGDDGVIETLPFSILQDDVFAGEQELPIAGLEGLLIDGDSPFFVAGQKALLNPGEANEEAVLIVSVDPLLLESPLNFDHELGEMIVVLSDTLAEILPEDSGETDTDNDGVLDINDNCPNTANPDQSNVGGTIVGAGDTIGDACQCGDVNNSGTVDNTDAVLIVRFAAGLPPGVDASKCDVTGDEVCDNSDADQIRSYLLGTSTNSLQQCAAALPISVVEGGDASQTTGEGSDSEGSDDALDTDTFNSEELQEYNIPVPAVISLMLLLVFTTVVSRRRIKI